jgi:hypothetical protein
MNEIANLQCTKCLTQQHLEYSVAGRAARQMVFV